MLSSASEPHGNEVGGTAEDPIGLPAAAPHEEEAVVASSSWGCAAMLLLAGTGVEAWAGPVVEERVGWVPLDELGARLTVDHGVRRGDDGRVWVRARGSAEAFGVHASAPLPPPPQGYRTPDDSPAWWDRASLQGKRVVLGVSHQGRTIDAVWFGAPPGAGKPAVRLLAGHHGDEGSSWELALDVVDRLLAADSGLVESLEERTLWVVPYVNPDGAQAHTRRNALSVDLNRNYDFQWVGGLDAGGAPLSEPETRAMARWGELVRPVLSISLHSGAENLGWVWNYTETPAPDAPQLVSLAEAYRDELGDPDFWLTNGAAWYVTHGDTNDWSYGRYGGWDYTLELTDTKSPPVDELDDALAGHLEAVVAMLTTELHPVTVVDASTGEPVAAAVVLDDGQPRWTDPVSGTTASPRPFREGWAEAPGYARGSVDADGVARLLPTTLASDADVRRGLTGEPCPPLQGEGPWTLHRGTYVTTIALGEPLPDAGIWWVASADGTVWPHGLVVGDATVDTRASGQAYLAGRPALMASSSIAGADVVWDRGEWLVVGDLTPATSATDESDFVLRGAGCASSPISGHLWVLALSILLWTPAGRTRRKA